MLAWNTIQPQVQEISTTNFKTGLPRKFTFMYKLDQVCTNNAQKNYLW